MRAISASLIIIKLVNLIYLFLFFIAARIDISVIY